jgi:hypothetical protein
MSLPRHSVFCRVEVLEDRPTIGDTERIHYQCLDATQGLHALTVRFGFAEQTSELGRMLPDVIRSDLGLIDSPTPPPELALVVPDGDAAAAGSDLENDEPSNFSHDVCGCSR